VEHAARELDRVTVRRDLRAAGRAVLTAAAPADGGAHGRCPRAAAQEQEFVKTDGHRAGQDEAV
jgi:hypothetical protein